jgi:hypothetical protein
MGNVFRGPCACYSSEQELNHTYHVSGGSRRNPNSLANLSKPGMTNNPGGRPKKTPLTDALRKLIESKDSLKIKPDDDNATKAAKYLLRLIASGKVSAFKEAADRVEGTVKEKVVYVGGEQEQGDRPVVIRVEYDRERKD